MLSINLNRSAVTLAVVAGVLAVAGPANAGGGAPGPTRLFDNATEAGGDGLVSSAGEVAPNGARVGMARWAALRAIGGSS